jgi:sugar O-acyltransferase (sialic acid O-acetyltransferase NeuD family)
MRSRILLIGGGGHCKSVLDTLLSANDYTEIGIIDKESNIGKQVLGFPTVGCDRDLPKLFRDGFLDAFVTIGSFGDTRLRNTLFKILEEVGFNIPNIVDPSAAVSSYAELKSGIFVGKKAVINAGAAIGRGVIINSSAVIEHDCVVGDFVHIAPGSVLCGGVKIGANTHVGANCVIRQEITVGANTIIGAGSAVVGNLHNNIVAYGNPCREVRTR